MDLNYTPQQRALRREVRDWLAANVPPQPLPSFDTEPGFQQHREWEARLNAGGWSMLTWPTEYGGRGCNLVEWLIFEEEYYRAGAPLRVNQNGIFLLGPTLMEYGSAAQRARFLPPMASGEEVWAQGWSEPGAGSDLAAIRCRAERRGDRFVINGQKTWSTRAVWADWCFGLFRTDPESRRHRGLSFLLLPLDSPGVTVRPIPQLDGLPGFAEIFFDDVEVPADNLLGEQGQGWAVAMATAGFERGLLLRSPARYQEAARRLVRLYRQQRPAADRDPALREAVLRAYLDAESYCLATYRTACRIDRGAGIGPESSTNKVFWSELDRQLHATAMRILGARAELLPGATAAQQAEAAELGDWLSGWLFSQAGAIYAGSNEIQRNIIAERMLGMPR